jgi:hypothetical protein
MMDESGFFDLDEATQLSVFNTVLQKRGLKASATKEGLAKVVESQKKFKKTKEELSKKEYKPNSTNFKERFYAWKKKLSDPLMNSSQKAVILDNMAKERKLYLMLSGTGLLSVIDPSRKTLSLLRVK